MKKVLVPTDFSEFANHAYATAAAITKKLEAELILLHVNEQVNALLPVAEFGYVYDREIEEKYLNMVYENLEKALAELTQLHPGLSIRPVVMGGLFLPTVEEMVANEHIDLVVMGTKGASGLKEFLVGSNTEKVVRRVNCPVLTVHQRVLDGFGDVVVPTTFEDDQRPVFEALQEWRGLIGGKIHLLYINNPGAYRGDTDLEARKAQLLAGLNLPEVEVFKTDTFTMNEEKVIFDFAKEKKADLIVMGTHQRRGLAHFLLGSLTEDTINHADLPVLTVPIR